MRAVPFLVSETSSRLGSCFRRHGWGECSHGLKACRLPPAGKPIRHDKKSDKSFAHFRLFFIANSLVHFNAQNDRVLQSVYNQRIVVGSVWRHSFSRRFCLRRLSLRLAIAIFSPCDRGSFARRNGVFGWKIRTRPVGKQMIAVRAAYLFRLVCRFSIACFCDFILTCKTVGNLFFVFDERCRIGVSKAAGRSRPSHRPWRRVAREG